MSVMPLKFGIGWQTANYTGQVAIHGLDGSVTITHGGIECGQGVNTKVRNIIWGLFTIQCPYMDSIRYVIQVSAYSEYTL